MNSTGNVMVISPEAEHCEVLRVAARKCGLAATYCRRFAEARILLADQRPRVVFCHDALPDGTLSEIIATVNPTPVVVLSHLAEWDRYFAALDAGAYDYLAYPPNLAETERIVRAALQMGCNEGNEETLDTGSRFMVAGAS